MTTARARAFAPLLAALPVLLGGCPGDLQDPDRFRAPDCDAQADIFQVTCGVVGCHAGDPPQNMLDFSAPDLESQVVGVASVCDDTILRVDPTAPENSLIYRKVADEMPPCGSRMPFGMDPLSDEDIACVLAWVEEAAGAGGGGDGGAAPTDGGAATDGGAP